MIILGLIEEDRFDAFVELTTKHPKACDNLMLYTATSLKRSRFIKYMFSECPNACVTMDKTFFEILVGTHDIDFIIELYKVGIFAGAYHQHTIEMIRRGEIDMFEALVKAGSPFAKEIYLLARSRDDYDQIISIINEVENRHRAKKYEELKSGKVDHRVSLGLDSTISFPSD